MKLFHIGSLHSAICIYVSSIAFSVLIAHLFLLNNIPLCYGWNCASPITIKEVLISRDHHIIWKPGLCRRLADDVSSAGPHSV